MILNFNKVKFSAAKYIRLAITVCILFFFISVNTKITWKIQTINKLINMIIVKRYFKYLETFPSDVSVGIQHPRNINTLKATDSPNMFPSNVTTKTKRKMSNSQYLDVTKF